MNILTAVTEKTESSEHTHSLAATPIPGAALWRSLRHLWCRHRDTTLTPKSATMPAHRLCTACGWREPVIAEMPKATSTWDSTRDEDRYEREKKRRNAIENQRRTAIAQMSIPGAKPARTRRAGQSNVVAMNRTHVG